jgi:hypothetical protein
MLENKKYHVFHERMIIMPSNWTIPTKYPLSKMLLEIILYEIQKILDDVEKGVIRRTKPLLIDKIISKICELEKIPARNFGK